MMVRTSSVVESKRGGGGHYHSHHGSKATKNMVGNVGMDKASMGFKSWKQRKNIQSLRFARSVPLLVKLNSTILHEKTGAT